MIAGHITEIPLRRGWVLRLTDVAGSVGGNDRAPSSAQGFAVEGGAAPNRPSALQYGLVIGCLSIINVLAFMEVIFN